MASRSALRTRPGSIRPRSSASVHNERVERAAGRSRHCFAGGKCKPFDKATQAGLIWADADNRLTVTGTDPTGEDATKFGKGGCVVNCNNQVRDLYCCHPDGANVVFADGSVRFVKQSISVVTLAALVTRTGGEKIDPNIY